MTKLLSDDGTKPCPCCGSLNIEWSHDGADYAYVECLDCTLNVNVDLTKEDPFREARDKWNTRAQPPSAETINHERLIEWIRNPKRLPAHRAFTDSIERQIAYAIAWAEIDRLKSLLAAAPQNNPDTAKMYKSEKGEIILEIPRPDWLDQDTPATSDATVDSTHSEKAQNGANAVLSTQDGPEGTLDRGITNTQTPVQGEHRLWKCDKDGSLSIDIESDAKRRAEQQTPDVDVEKLREAIRISSRLDMGSESCRIIMRVARAHLAMMEKQNEQI